MIAVTGRESAAKHLRNLGHPAKFFADGLAMEESIRTGEVTALLDLAPVELLADGSRLIAAAIAGLPQVIGLEGLTGTPEALDALGKRIAEIASAARGPTRVLVPTTGGILVESIRNWAHPPSLLLEYNSDLETPAIAELLRLLGEGS